MPSGNRPVYYWDANMWIVYLNGGTEHPDVFERADEIVKLIRRNQVIVITSVITRAELLEQRLGPQRLRFYDEQFARKNVIEQPVTRSVCMKASDYRGHFRSLRRGAKFADAIHLATAVDNNVDELHTTDAEDLLPCNGDQILRGTQVIRPVSTKPNLLTGVSPLLVGPATVASPSSAAGAPDGPVPSELGPTPAPSPVKQPANAVPANTADDAKNESIEVVPQEDEQSPTETAAQSGTSAPKSGTRGPNEET